jgi:uncharacterized protein DUF4349
VFVSTLPRIGVRAFLFAVTLTAIACNEVAKDGISDQSLQIAAEPSSAPAPQVADFAARRGVAFTEMAKRERSAASPVRFSPGQATSPEMIIRNGDVSVQVDSLEIAIERVRQLATSLGGSLGNVSVNTGERQVRSATLQMKVPSARFDDAMHGMTPLGKVERSTTTAEDVGEEFVDVNARVANAKRLESRLVALLATRTGKLEDVLAVERELARVREEIERYEGRIRYLSSRVAISTIGVLVHERPPLIASQPGTNVLGHAFVNMWRNFVAFIAVGIESLGILLPVGALAWLLLWRWKRSRVGRVTAAA